MGVSMGQVGVIVCVCSWARCVCVCWTLLGVTHTLTCTHTHSLTHSHSGPRSDRPQVHGHSQPGGSVGASAEHTPRPGIPQRGGGLPGQGACVRARVCVYLYAQASLCEVVCLLALDTSVRWRASWSRCVRTCVCVCVRTCTRKPV